MPWSLQTRAAAIASSSSSPATKRCDIRRVVRLEVTQRAKPWFSDSCSSVERSMYLLIMPVTFRRYEWPLPVFVLFQELFRVNGRHAAGGGRGHRLPVAMVLHVARDKNSGHVGNAAMFGFQV